MYYDIVESKGFGVVESPIIEMSRKTFNDIGVALNYLYINRKDKNLSWNNWETPYTYKIQSHIDGKLIKSYTDAEINILNNKYNLK